MYRLVAVLVVALALSGCMSGSPLAPTIPKVRPLARNQNAEAGTIRAVSATYVPGMVTIDVVTQDAEEIRRSFLLGGGVIDPGVHVDSQVKPDYGRWLFLVNPDLAAEGDSFPFYFWTTDTLPSGLGRFSIRGNRIRLELPVALVSDSSYVGVSTSTWNPGYPLSRILSLPVFTPVAFTPAASRP